MKEEAGLALTKKLISLPARTLVREQYPSIHGQRYFVFGSMRVFCNSQSCVPGFSFSRRTKSRLGDAPGIPPADVERTEEQPPKVAVTPSPSIPLISCRRVMPGWSLRDLAAFVRWFLFGLISGKLRYASEIIPFRIFRSPQNRQPIGTGDNRGNGG